MARAIVTKISLPAASLCDYAGTTAPFGWLMCDGSSVSTTTYSVLFAAIGYAYGGAGASFNLPDYRGRFARYNDNMGTGAAGRDTGRVHGSTQTQTTAKNGLRNQPSGTNGSFSTGPASNSSWRTGVIPGGSPGGQWSGHHPSRGSSLSGFNGDGTFPGQDHTHAGYFTGVAEAQSIISDAETRPINLSCNKIIKI